MQLRLSFFLFTSLLATVVVDEAVSSQSPACDQVRSDLWSMTGWNFRNVYDPIYWMEGDLEPYLQGTCPDSIKLQESVSEVGEACDDDYLMKEVQFLLNNTERICIEQALEDARSFPNKDCVTDESQRSRFKNRFEDCYIKYLDEELAALEASPHAFCAVWHLFMTCVTTITTEDCGIDVSRFIEPLWNIHVDLTCYRLAD